MNSTRFATLCVALGLAAFLTLNSHAAVYNDASNDLFDNGFDNLDITSIEVTNSATTITFKVTTRGFQNWTKYMIWLDTPSKANAASNNHGWGRTRINLASGEGADFFIGSWVDAPSGNAQVWEYNSTWNQHSSSPLSNTVSGNTVSFNVPLNTLGLSAGNVIRFEADGENN